MSKATISAVQDAASAEGEPDEALAIEKRLAAQGTKLSPIQHKPLSWFKLNPLNDHFRDQKSAQYWKDLERDIREIGLIKSPAIAMQDGLLLEGESRLIISQKLAKEEVDGFDTLPVRIVLSPLSAEEQKKLLYLGNLNRFDIDSDLKIALFAEIYPGYFDQLDKKAGRPKNYELSSQLPKSPQTASQVAKALGKTTRQVQKDKRIYQRAKALARDDGREKPSAADVKAAKKLQAAQANKPVTRARPVLRANALVLELTKAEADEMLTALALKPTALRRQIITKIRKAKIAQARK